MGCGVKGETGSIEAGILVLQLCRDPLFVRIMAGDKGRIFGQLRVDQLEYQSHTSGRHQRKQARKRDNPL